MRYKEDPELPALHDFFHGCVRSEPPAQGHSQTSTAAGAAIKPDRNRLRNRVLAFLRGCGSYGATDEEVQERLAMNPSTQRPRRVELVEAGLVVDSGQTRLTKAGRKATIWTAAE